MSKKPKKENTTKRCMDCVHYQTGIILDHTWRKCSVGNVVGKLTRMCHKGDTVYHG